MKLNEIKLNEIWNLHPGSIYFSIWNYEYDSEIVVVTDTAFRILAKSTFFFHDENMWNEKQNTL